MKKLTPEQLDRMSPESRQRYEKRFREVKRNRTIRAVVLTAVAMIAIGILCAVFLFRITDITVAKAGAIYTSEEIINASGLNKGDTVMLTDFDKVASRIQTNLPYVLEADISKNISGRIQISIKDTAAAMLIDLKNSYAVADIHGKILEKVDKKPQNSNLLLLKTKNKIEAEPGMFFKFASEQEKLLYDKLVEELEKAGIFENITMIDISDNISVKIEYQNRLRILLGTSDDLDVKLKSCIKVIETEDKKDPALVAEINSKIPKKVFVNPVDSLHPEDEEDTTEPVTDVTDTTDTGEGTTGLSEPVTDTSTTEPEDTTDHTEETSDDDSESTTQVSEENEEN